MKFKVVIPSYKRANIVLNHPMFKQSLVVVKKDQLGAYKSASEEQSISPLEFVELPDDVNGIAQTRHWIVENLYENKDDFIFMMDDDISSIRYLMTRTVRESKDPNYIMDVIEHVGTVASQAQSGVFGFAHTPRPQERSWNRPFVIRSWISAYAMGVVSRDIQFDPQCFLKEDIDISLSSIQKTRLAWKDCRWAFVADRWDNLGGLQTIRTYDREMQAAQYLTDKWGEGVIVTNNKRKTGLGISVRVNG